MSEQAVSKEKKQDFSKQEFIAAVLNDFRIANESREASLMGRREVLSGKAKFGIFGDGKELAQLAMAKVFQNGDFRSGYYRDQTFMFASDNLTLQQWFAGLYGNTDQEAEPMSAGRQMGGHFATRSLNPDGSWKDLTKIKNSSADISPTGWHLNITNKTPPYKLQLFRNFRIKGTKSLLVPLAMPVLPKGYSGKP